MTWKNLNPEWELRYFDFKQREDFVKSEAPELMDYYRRSSPLVQSDIWRMLAVYKFGGVYADMDTICIKPLDYMLDSLGPLEIITEPRYETGKVNIALFAAIKESPVIGKVIDSVKSDTITNWQWHVWLAFNKHVTDQRIALFSAGDHSKDFNTSFWDFDVDYYGTTMKYNDYLKDVLKLTGEEYRKNAA